MHFESVCGYLCDMKKSTIWIIASVMGVFFLTLLFLQAKYFEEVINMRKEQFDESVTRSLYQTARNLELNETKRGLEVQLGNRTTLHKLLTTDYMLTFQLMCQKDCS